MTPLGGMIEPACNPSSHDRSWWEQPQQILVGASLLANSALVVLQAAGRGTLLRGPLQAIHGRLPKVIHGL